MASALAELSSAAGGGRLARDFVAVKIAQQRWTDEWARLAAEPQLRGQLTGSVAGTLDQGQLAEFLVGGKKLFDDYRLAQEAFSRDIGRALADVDATVNDWLVWSGVAQALAALLVAVIAFGGGRRLRRLVAAPVSSIARTVAELRAGNLDARVPETAGPTELRKLSSDVDEMAVALQTQAALAESRAQDAVRHSDRLALVLGVAREVAGSLSLRYVLETVTGAACRIGNLRARVWLVEEDGRLAVLSFDTESGHKGPAVILRVAVGVGGVGRAVKYGRPIGPEPTEQAGQVVLAVPMIIGGRVVGVLECLRPARALGNAQSPADVAATLEILEALAGQAAGSVEAARLHEHTRELSVTDSLTMLPNRRAFDEELSAEVRRALRYGRPLSVIFLDLDHFKALNDRYGHHYGDTALQQVAAALRANLRDTDRCYRLGGEELIVIAPETTSVEAARAAERLRVAIEGCAEPGSPKVTASFGVAELPSHADDGAGLVRAADRAVYAAKANGRNCVVVSEGAASPPRAAVLPPRGSVGAAPPDEPVHAEVAR